MVENCCSLARKVPALTCALTFSGGTTSIAVAAWMELSSGTNLLLRLLVRIYTVNKNTRYRVRAFCSFAGMRRPPAGESPWDHFVSQC